MVLRLLLRLRTEWDGGPAGERPLAVDARPEAAGFRGFPRRLGRHCGWGSILSHAMTDLRVFPSFSFDSSSFLGRHHRCTFQV